MKYESGALAREAIEAVEIVNGKKSIEACIKFSAPALRCISNLLQGILERDAKIAQLQAAVDVLDQEMPSTRLIREKDFGAGASDGKGTAEHRAQLREKHRKERGE